MKNEVKVAWGITGAGHYLKDSFDLFVEVKHRQPERAKITSFVSRAAEEVARVYGLFHCFPTVSPGAYMEELILETEQGWSFPKTGRFSRGIYDALFITPATSNTVAKIVHGIADSLITNAATHAMKAGVPVFIVPVDIAGEVNSPVPYFINREVCTECGECARACPNDAIEKQIDYLRCTGCGLCKDVCDYNAIQGGMVNLVVRDIDRSNVRKLRKLAGITVLKDPNELKEALLALF